MKKKLMSHNEAIKISNYKDMNSTSRVDVNLKTLSTFRSPANLLVKSYYILDLQERNHTSITFDQM